MDERLKILKLLEEGKINAEEAERLLRALTSAEKREKVKVINIDEFITGLERLKANVNAGTLEIKKRGSSSLTKKGIVEYRREGNEGYIAVMGGVCEISLVNDIPIDVNVSFGNCSVETGADFSASVKLGNLELTITKPVNINIENSFSNTEIYYTCEPDARFEIENSMGAVENYFKNQEGSRFVKIKNNFGSVSVNKKTGG